MNHDPDRINALERLPRRRRPERDLWPGIEARLAPRRSRMPWLPLALAASVVAGFAVLLAPALRPGGTAPAADVAVAPQPLPLTFDARAIVAANADLVEDAERQLRWALEQDPDSETLRTLLRNTQQRQRALRAML